MNLCHNSNTITHKLVKDLINTRSILLPIVSLKHIILFLVKYKIASICLSMARGLMWFECPLVTLSIYIVIEIHYIFSVNFIVIWLDISQYYSDMSILIIDVTVFHDNKYTLICILSYQSYYTVYYEHKLHSLIL